NLDRVMGGVPILRTGGLGPWKLVRLLDPFPPAWTARRVHIAQGWGQLYTELSRADALDDAWLLSEDCPPSRLLPGAESARVDQWDGYTATVTRDGACMLTVRQTYYPGWHYRIDDGPALPVLRVNGGLQGIWLPGAGTSQVTLLYRPTGLKQAVA